MRSFENYRFRLSHKNRTAEKIKRAQFGIELHSFNDSFFPIKPFPQHNIIFVIGIIALVTIFSQHFQGDTHFYYNPSYRQKTT